MLVQLLTDLGTWQPTKEMVNTQMNAYITAFKATQSNDDSGVKKQRVMGFETITMKRRMQPEKEGEVDPKNIVRKDLLKFSKKQNNTFACLWFMVSAYDPTLDEFFEPRVDGMSWAEMLLVEQILRKPTGEYRGQMMRIHEFDAVRSSLKDTSSPFLSDLLHEKVYEDALDTYAFIENQFASLFELTEENQKKKMSLKAELKIVGEEEETWLSRLSLSFLDDLIRRDEDEYQKEETLLNSTRDSLEETKKPLFTFLVHNALKNPDFEARAWAFKIKKGKDSQKFFDALVKALQTNKGAECSRNGDFVVVFQADASMDKL